MISASNGAIVGCLLVGGCGGLGRIFVWGGPRHKSGAAAPTEQRTFSSHASRPGRPARRREKAPANCRCTDRRGYRFSHAFSQPAGRGSEPSRDTAWPALAAGDSGSRLWTRSSPGAQPHSGCPADGALARPKAVRPLRWAALSALAARGRHGLARPAGVRVLLDGPAAGHPRSPRRG